MFVFGLKVHCLSSSPASSSLIFRFFISLAILLSTSKSVWDMIPSDGMLHYNYGNYWMSLFASSNIAFRYFYANSLLFLFIFGWKVVYWDDYVFSSFLRLAYEDNRLRKNNWNCFCNFLPSISSKLNYLSSSGSSPSSKLTGFIW